MDNRVTVGILAIIFGILLMVFPIFSQFILSVIAGIGILILGIYCIVLRSHLWGSSKVSSVLHIILGVLGIIVGIMLVGNVLLFDTLISLYLYIVGFMLLFSGLVGLFTRIMMPTKVSTNLMALLGIITLILGYFALLSPLYATIILGLILIIDGIAICIGMYRGVLD
ncbi:hypothetical protein ALNOE001_01210 [Candidatus Methanobinarius endosymbioticus]|uniref:Acid-resistance membrane protein n=1 Tax=Candidatus Methanobinarius endosymbioticus TaxID=2006182 RepID=A0A366MFV6_9EURY|nr:hypothetical protein ALNOE001_01210 [Candidatus Methanobinarius endosymbioticus]